MSVEQHTSRSSSLIVVAVIVAIIIALVTPFTGIVDLVIIAALLAFKRRIGRLRAAALLVTLGTVSLLEHSGFSIVFALRLGSVVPEAFQLVLTQHSRLHFFMAAIYTLIAMALILFVAWGGLLHGRRSAWWALLGVLLVGGGAELLAGALIFQHGSPIYAPFGIPIRGFNWQFLDMYLLAWPLALAVSVRPMFKSRDDETM